MCHIPCPHPGAVRSVLFVSCQAETGGAPEQEHEDPHDRRTDPGGALPLHGPRLQCHPGISSGVPQIHRSVRTKKNVLHYANHQPVSLKSNHHNRPIKMENTKHTGQ